MTLTLDTISLTDQRDNISQITVTTNRRQTDDFSHCRGRQKLDTWPRGQLVSWPRVREQQVPLCSGGAPAAVGWFLPAINWRWAWNSPAQKAHGSLVNGEGRKRGRETLHSLSLSLSLTLFSSLLFSRLTLTYRKRTREFRAVCDSKRDTSPEAEGSQGVLCVRCDLSSTYEYRTPTRVNLNLYVRNVGTSIPWYPFRDKGRNINI